MSTYIILVIQVLLAGGTQIIASVVSRTMPAANLTFLRTLISASVYLSYVLYRRLLFGFRSSDLVLLVILGLLSVPINQFVFLYGISFTTATDAALLYATTPVLVLIISRIYLKEKLHASKIAGAALAFTGVAIIVLENGFHIGISHVKGDLFVFAGVIAWSLYTTFGRKLVVKYGAVPTTVFGALIGTSLFAPIGIYSSIGFNYSAISTQQWMEILYLALGTSVAGYVLWYTALSKIEASKVAVFANGQPVATAILAFIFLGQGITLTFALGAVVTIAGVFITQLEPGGKSARALR